ncbi:MAG TPA: protein-disulfide reductase DsbD domain-containing protein [Candidatus Acidoferrum sp.]|nr:protein-disulfide reductase DsbD domain-containing protein [Candidatus Acidoferrum sp.]
MRRFLTLLIAAWAGAGGFPARAAHTQAGLVLAAQTARPGDAVMAGVRLRMDANWHTYWRNPGAAGMPTTVNWQLPPGVSAGAIQWPVPEKLPDEDLTTYIYKDEVVLLVPLKLAADVRPGPLELKADVGWLECNVACVPGKAEVQAALTVGPETQPSKDAALIAAWEKKLPQSSTGLSARAGWEGPAKGDLRPLVLEWNSPVAVSEADFYPDASEHYEVQGATTRLPADAGKVRLRVQVKTSGSAWPERISGLLVQQSGVQRQAFEASLAVEPNAPPTAAVAASANLPAPRFPIPPLWKALVYAFIGGLILNLMPCVLPVIALKILGFVNQAKNDPRQTRRLGLIYGLGVLVSFLALALLFVGLQSAGHRVGWGIQFNSPYFLVVMTTVVTLIALNLFGVFEVYLGGRAMGAAASASSREGAAGAFFNGLLATVLATSCTAPFLAAAAGFALAPGQTAALTILTFLMLGVGLAFPYVVLSWQPAWLKFVPKPGPWMERFKVAMGFPMLAAAVWLFSLVTIHYGDRSWWLALFLVMVAVAAWIYGEFIQRHHTRPVLALAAILAVLLAAYTFALEGHLQWRRPLTESAPGSTPTREANGVAWEPWSPAALAQARNEGRPVLVDFTARWCLTCNTIVKPALESASVRDKLRQLNAVALLGDYTGFPDNITEELNRFGQAGVPLVLVYPRNAQEPPIVLPQALTPGMVVAALDRAGK